jgi:ATP-binding cassette, subfamily B, bacterial
VPLAVKQGHQQVTEKMKVPEAPRTSHRQHVSFVLRGRRAAIVWVATSSFLGGLVEALFLVTVTRAAFAITAGKSQVGIVADRFLTVQQTLLFGFVLVLVRLALALLSNWQSSRLAATIIADLRRRLAASFLNASWPIQQSQRGGSLQELLTSYVGGASGVATGVLALVLASTNLAALLGLAISIDPLGALVLIFTVGALGSMLRPLRAAVRRRARSAAQAGMRFATSLNEVSQLGLELHVFHVQETAKRRVDDLIDESRQKGQRVGFASASVSPIYSVLAYTALVGALTVASYSASASLTSLGAVLLVMMRSLNYGQSIQSAYTTISGATPFVEQLRASLEYFDTGRVADGGKPVGNVAVLRVDDVSFSYVEGQEVLTHLSFEIDRQEIIGIVGPSGGGKSTLVQLLLGLRRPDSGTVLADGRDIHDLSRSEWARKVTFVPQSSHLIVGTIADNIRFLREDVTDEEVEQAAKLAHLHDDVTGFPEGYQRQVGEQGGQLSGGQQQRLCIARALVENPDVLILDEPTSALDVRSEHLVRTTLLGMKERATVIVIAHRLSTLEICDRIMVIQNGELKGFDTPARLEQSNDFYREALVLSGMR